MNKTRKNHTESMRSNPVLLSGSHPKVEIHTDQVANIPGIDQEIPQIWKPMDQHSEHDDAWFAMTQDLLHNFDQLAKLFRNAMISRSWLNAYLLAAGLSQVVEDYLHSRFILLVKVADFLIGLPGPVGAFLGKLSPHVLSLWGFLIDRNRSDRKLRAWQQKLTALLERLAGVLLTYDPPDQFTETGLVADGGSLVAYIPYFPVALRDSTVQLPASFRNFDQQPEDFRRIVDEFSIHWTELDKPLVVVGVQPSGSYLVPFYTSVLRSLGYHNVQAITIRPYTPLLNHEVEIIQGVLHENGLALLCDEPPVAGWDLIDSATLLEEMGIPRSNIILMLGLLGNYDSLPDELQKYPSVLVSWQNWNIFHRLELSSIKKVLSDACDPAFELVDLERIPYVEAIEKREHVFARYRLKVVNASTHQEVQCTIQVQGVGLGYLGEHALAVSQRLPAYSSRLIALQGGLLFQEVSEEAQPLSASRLIGESQSIDTLVNYVLERNRQLPTPQDLSFKLDGRHAAWEVARDLLRLDPGRSGLFARPSILDAYLKGALKVSNPSIVDGDMSLQHWYLQGGNAKPLIKTFMADKDFSQSSLWCYDPVYDLACLALEANPAIQPSRLRRSYEALSGTSITPEKWVLYQLIRLWEQGGQEHENSTSMERAMSQAVERYFSEIYFQDLDTLKEGTLCSFDIDGVLETRPHGFLTLSAASAMGLRALNQHGYRVLLATGRSLEELVERCAAYKLPGGVAEFGAVLYDHASGQVVSILRQAEQDILNQVRSRLSNQPDVYLDNDYRFAVRAYYLDEFGCREQLDEQLIQQVLLDTGAAGQVYAIQGETQSDFMVRRIDKGVGLKAWLACFDPTASLDQVNPNDLKPFDLAVGDSNTDLPMLDLAAEAYAPASASQGVRQAGIPLTSRPEQRGFEQALVKHLGHVPGSCPVCHREPLSYSTIFMQDVLSGQQYAHPGALWQVMKHSFVKNRFIHVKSK